MFKPIHARLGRTALGWSLLDLEKQTGISKNTLVRFEGGGGVHHATATKIEKVLSKEGITFLYEDAAHGPGVVISKDLSHRLGEGTEPRPKTKPAKPK